MPDNVLIHFEGGPRRNPAAKSVKSTGPAEITLVWSAVEGGRYTVESTPSLEVGSWVPEVTGLMPDRENLSYSPGAPKDPAVTTRNFFRSRIESLAPFDESGLGDFEFTPLVTHVFQFPVSPARAY